MTVSANHFAHILRSKLGYSQVSLFGSNEDLSNWIAISVGSFILIWSCWILISFCVFSCMTLSIFMFSCRNSSSKSLFCAFISDSLIPALSFIRCMDVVYSGFKLFTLYVNTTLDFSEIIVAFWFKIQRYCACTFHTIEGTSHL